jgi:hypothetical protein
MLLKEMHDRLPEIHHELRKAGQHLGHVQSLVRESQVLALSDPLIVDSEIRANPNLVKTHGLLLDQINLGPRPRFGNKFPISDFDAIVVEGDTPSVCPKTDRPIDVEWLPTILQVFRRVGLVKAGQTIHWVGSQSKLEHVCTCFREQTEQAPIDLLTTDELAWLADVSPSTFNKRISECRRKTHQGIRPPKAIRRGNRPGSYSYSQIRPWLCDQWKAKAFRFPESFKEVRQALLNRPTA